MKTIAIVGGNKNFEAYLLKVLNLTEVECATYTKYAVKNQSQYDYVIFNSMTNIKDISINGGYCFVNMDLIEKNSNNVNIYGNIITYGLGSKNTVTVSSVEHNIGFVYCLQRDINHNALGNIEPHELPVNMAFKDDQELYAAMIGITISLIEAKDTSNLSKEKKLTVLN